MDEGWTTGHAYPRIQFAEGVPLDAGERQKILGRIKYQRLRPLARDGSPAGDSSGRVERVFTDAAPEKFKFSGEVKTSNGKTLKVHASDDAFYIERPATADDLGSFLNVVRGEEITSQRLESMITARGPPKSLAGPAPESAAARVAAESQIDLARARFEEEVQKYGLDAAIERFDEDYATRALDAIRGGKSVNPPPPGAKGIPSADTPNRKVLEAVASVEHKEYAKAVEDATRAFAGRPPSPRTVVAALAYADSRGAAELGEYFAIKSGMMHPEMSPEMRANLKVEFHNGKIEVILDVKPETPLAPIFGAERDTAVATLMEGATPAQLYYVEDSRPLSKLDGTASPGASLSDASRTRRIVWTRYTPKGLDGHMPPKVRVDGRVYQRSLIGGATSTGPTTGLPPVWYLVRECDPAVDQDCEDKK
jgi:hypothetical protein